MSISRVKALIRFLAINIGILGVSGYASAVEFRQKLQGLVQVNYVDAANETSFLEGGVSPFRYDNQDSNVHLGQLFLNYRAQNWHKFFGEC